MDGSRKIDGRQLALNNKSAKEILIIVYNRNYLHTSNIDIKSIDYMSIKLHFMSKNALKNILLQR